MARRVSDRTITMLVIEIDKLVAMHAIKGKNDHDHEIGDEQRRVEGIPLVQVAEWIVDRVVAVVGTQVVAEAVLGIKPEPGIRGCVLEERWKLDQVHFWGPYGHRACKGP